MTGATVRRHALAGPVRLWCHARSCSVCPRVTTTMSPDASGAADVSAPCAGLRSHSYATPRNTRCHHLRVSTSCQLNCRARFSFQPWMHRPESPIRQSPGQSPRQCLAVPKLRHASTLTPERDHEDAGPDHPPGKGDGTIGIMAGVVIVGAGPGIGLSVARRFAAAGMPAGRRRAHGGEHRQHAGGPGRDGRHGGGSDRRRRAGRPAHRGARRRTGQLGPPGALIYNAGLIRHDRPGELSRDQYVTAYAINVLGAMTAAVHLAPAMAKAGGGSILITGGMPEPDPALTSLSLGKAGVRALTTLLAGEYGPRASTWPP